VEAGALHAEVLVIDAHEDILCDVRARRRNGETGVISRRHLPALRAGSIDAMVFPIYLTPYLPESALRESLLMIDDLRQECAESPEDLRTICSAAELDAERGRGRLAILLSLEGAEPLGLDLGILRLFYDLGLRALGLTWARRTMVADGNLEEGTGGGLTRFGREVVRECARLGILIDVSHLSPAGFWDVMRLAGGPIVASHSNARALCDHPRNLTDEQLRAIAETGGVVGLNAYSAFVHPTSPSLDFLLDHAEHMGSVMGPGHLGIGFDFPEYLPDDDGSRLDGLRGPEDTAALTGRLLARGVSEREIRAILGENWLGVWRRVLG
jgi:membrane dipeptidase